MALIGTKQDCKSSPSCSGCFVWEWTLTPKFLRSCPFELCETWNSALGLAKHNAVMKHGLIPAHFICLSWSLHFPSLLSNNPPPRQVRAGTFASCIHSNWNHKKIPLWKLDFYANLSPGNPLAYFGRVLGSCQNLMPAHFFLVLVFVMKCSHSISMLGFFLNVLSTYLSIYPSLSLFFYILLCCFIFVYWM